MFFDLFAHPLARNVREPVPVYVPHDLRKRTFQQTPPVSHPVDEYAPLGNGASSAERVAVRGAEKNEDLACLGVHEKLDKMIRMLRSIDTRLEKVEEELDESEEEVDESEESEDDHDLDLGQAVEYADGPKKRLATVVAVDTSHDPPSYTIKFEDGVDLFRETVSEYLYPL